jgi:hypothetical protein
MHSNVIVDRENEGRYAGKGGINRRTSQPMSVGAASGNTNQDSSDRFDTGTAVAIPNTVTVPNRKKGCHGDDILIGANDGNAHSNDIHVNIDHRLSEGFHCKSPLTPDQSFDSNSTNNNANRRVDQSFESNSTIPSKAGPYATSPQVQEPAVHYSASTTRTAPRSRNHNAVDSNALDSSAVDSSSVVPDKYTNNSSLNTPKSSPARVLLAIASSMKQSMQGSVGSNVGDVNERTLKI